MRKFLVSPTVLKNLRYFIRPLYFSRTGWRAQRLVKNLPQQTIPFRNPADRTFTFSLSLSLLKIKPFILSKNWLEKFVSYFRSKFIRKFVSEKLKFVSIISFTFNEYFCHFARWTTEWINLVTNIFNKIGYSTKCWKNIKGFLIFFIDRSIYEKVVWWSIREISFLLWNILAAISILS